MRKILFAVGVNEKLNSTCKLKFHISAEGNLLFYLTLFAVVLLWHLTKDDSTDILLKSDEER